MPGDKNAIRETHLRSVVKGIVWRLLGSFTTVIIVYLLTRELVIAAEVGGIEILAKIFVYYSYERIWNAIKWGRSTQILE